AWAVGWFFVPVANLIRPYQVLREVCANSNPRSEASSGRTWVDGCGPLVIKLWWCCSLLALLPGLVPLPEGLIVPWDADLPDGLKALLILRTLWRHTTTLLAGSFGVLMIWLIRHHQVNAAAA